MLFLSQVSFQMLNKICFTHFHLLLFTNSNGLHYPLLLVGLVVIYVYYNDGIKDGCRLSLKSRVHKTSGSFNYVHTTLLIRST